MKARVCLLGLVVFCSACAAPSLRYKTEVNRLIAQEKFEAAADMVVANRTKNYSKQDYALAYLDEAVLRHEAGSPQESDKLFEQAQDRMEELYTVSITKYAGRLVVNDLTLPYDVAPYEKSLTFFYRAMDFLEQDNLTDAAVEARRAVQFLDSLRGHKTKGYNDDPFVQYFTSLIFEMTGERSDARISRQNALNGYEKLGDLLRVNSPEFFVPTNANDLGEVVIFHYNGLLPLKRRATVQMGWNRAIALLSEGQESVHSDLGPEVINALQAGFMGNAITISYPQLVSQPFAIVSSVTQTSDGQLYMLQKMSDLSAVAEADLDERMPGILFRSVSRAINRQLAAKAAREAIRKSSNDKQNPWGDVAEIFVNMLGASVEKADTRQWFTLPAQIFMTRLFLPPGKQNIRLLFRDGFGNIIGEHIFEDVHVQKGKRIFLHYRTAK